MDDWREGYNPEQEPYITQRGESLAVMAFQRRSRLEAYKLSMELSGGDFYFDPVYKYAVWALNNSQLLVPTATCPICKKRTVSKFIFFTKGDRATAKVRYTCCTGYGCEKKLREEVTLQATEQEIAVSVRSLTIDWLAGPEFKGQRGPIKEVYFWSRGIPLDLSNPDEAHSIILSAKRASKQK